jgi:hypothetical protein
MDSVLYELGQSVQVAVNSTLIARCRTEHDDVTGPFRRVQRVSRFLVCPPQRTCN